MSNLLLIDDDPEQLVTQVRQAFPTTRNRIARSISFCCHAFWITHVAVNKRQPAFWESPGKLCARSSANRGFSQTPWLEPMVPRDGASDTVTATELTRRRTPPPLLPT